MKQARRRGDAPNVTAAEDAARAHGWKTRELRTGHVLRRHHGQVLPVTNLNHPPCPSMKDIS